MQDTVPDAMAPGFADAPEAPADPIPSAIEARYQAARAVYGLSWREHECLGHLLNGLTDAAIARAMGIEASTVGDHVKAVYRKVGAESRIGAIRAVCGMTGVRVVSR